jgi:hypothetical protein
MNAISRINQRFGEALILQTTEDGTPLCPHCGKPMSKMDGLWWENSNCPCWWVGSQDGIYTAQVVVALTEAADKTYNQNRAHLDRDIERVEAERKFLLMVKFRAAKTVEDKLAVVAEVRYDLLGSWMKVRRAKFFTRAKAVIIAGGSFDEAIRA